MTLTEEQRAAIVYAISSLEQCGSEPEDPIVAKILRAMVDSSGTVGPSGGFDLERARGLRDFLQDDCAEVGDVWAEMIAEIERLRASLIDLHAEYINTLEKNPECSAWDLDEQSDADQRRLRRNAAHAISIVEPPIYLQAEQQAARIKELENALVEERTGAIRCESYDHCEGMYRIDLPDAMIRAQQELQAEGKIGPDAMPRSWQITKERKDAIDHGLRFLEWSFAATHNPASENSISILHNMLKEAE